VNLGTAPGTAEKPVPFPKALEGPPNTLGANGVGSEVRPDKAEAKGFGGAEHRNGLGSRLVTKVTADFQRPFSLHGGVAGSIIPSRPIIAKSITHLNNQAVAPFGT
jgi:hypothetical protein